MMIARVKAARQLVTARGLVEALANVALPALTVWFAYRHVVSFLATGRISVAIVVAFELLFVLAYLSRRPPSDTSFRLADWATTGLGTFLPLLLHPSAVERDVMAGEVFQIVGALCSVWGIATLNRRIGLVPANRGICTTGPYRFVRHPLYGAYAIGHVGYFMSNASVGNAVVIVAAFTFQVLRMRAEERLLLKDEAYRDYAKVTTWRIVPFVY